MERDPYDVLGIDKNATPEEIKKAYRKKVKEYHPDLHPNDDMATKKMNEVNEAYDRLTNPEKYRQTSFNAQRNSYGGNGEFSGFGGFDFSNFAGFYRMQVEYDAGDSPAMAGAVRAVNSGRNQGALEILQTIEVARRNARWFYVSAVANYNLGNILQASAHIQEAISKDPNNLTYRRVQQVMQQSGQTYRADGGMTIITSYMQRICLGLCLARLFCPWCC